MTQVMEGRPGTHVGFVQPFFNLMYFMLLPRAHFILYTLQGTEGLGPGPGDGIPGKIGEGNRLQPAADGFFLQYSLTDTPLLHAKHCAVIAWQQMRGTISTHFPGISFAWVCFQ